MQSYCRNKYSQHSSIFANGILQKQQYTPGLKHDITIAPNSVVSIILHKFHTSRGHQGTIHTFEAIKRSYWWPKYCQDVAKYINKWDIWATNLPNMAKYPQTHLEILWILMVVLGMDTIGYLPATSKEADGL